MGTNQQEMYTYTAYGLNFHSEIPLPELIESQVEAEADVVIKLGEINFPDVDQLSRGAHSLDEEGTVIFNWPGYGAFLLKRGEEIIVDILPEANLDVIRLPLLGSVLGVLLHQRGLFTLHASAVIIDDEVVAFVGMKGEGKSTTAALLHQAGYTLFVDDILAVDLEDNGDLMVHPGFPQVKLWPASFEALEKRTEELAELHPEYAKRGFRPEERFASRALPLRRIYVLGESSDIEIQPLSAREAFMQLVTHSYAARFLQQAGAGPDHFKQCQTLADSVSVCSLKRPKLFEMMPKVIDSICTPANQLS